MHLPKLFNDFRWPTEKELTQGTVFRGERLAEIMDMIRRCRGLDALGDMHQEAKKIINEPEFAAKAAAIRSLDKFMTAYLRIKHNIDINTGEGSEVGLYTSREVNKADLKGLADEHGTNYVKQLEALSKQYPESIRMNSDQEVIAHAEKNENKINVIQVKVGKRKVAKYFLDEKKVIDLISKYADDFEKKKDDKKYQERVDGLIASYRELDKNFTNTKGLIDDPEFIKLKKTNPKLTIKDFQKQKNGK